MKKMKKVQLLAATLGVMAAVTGFVFINNPIQAKAAEETATATFAMTKGAAVRAVQNEAGIRWETTVNKAWYDAVVAELEEGQTITNYSFGTWVTSANNVGSVTELDETFTNEVKDLPCKVTPDFTDETTTTFTYYSSIVYTAEDLAGYTDEEVKKAYATELIARSYMKYSTDGGNTYTYKYATSNNNQRCMRLVAMLAYYETDPNKALTDTQKGYVDDYFIKPEGDKLPTVDFGGYYETAIGKTNSAYTAAYYDGKQVGKADENDTLWVTLGNLGTKNYIIYLFDDKGNCAKTNVFRNITALLYQEKEGETVTKDTFKDYINVDDTIEGYYVLGSDIDLGGTYYGKANTFAGTLDGKGFTIRGIKNGEVTSSTTVEGGENSKGGLFLKLQGTIKNVSIVGSVGKQGGLITDICAAEATIEDVYVSASLFQSKSGAIARWIRNGANITMKNVVVEMVKTSTGKPGALFGFTDKPGNLSITLTLENCYYITTTGLSSLGNNTSGTYYSIYNNGDVALFGEKSGSDSVPTYANGLTGYTAADLDTAKDAFADAVTENSDMISDTLKELLLKANA